MKNLQKFLRRLYSRVWVFWSWAPQISHRTSSGWTNFDFFFFFFLQEILILSAEKKNTLTSWTPKMFRQNKNIYRSIHTERYARTPAQIGGVGGIRGVNLYWMGFRRHCLIPGIESAKRTFWWGPENLIIYLDVRNSR